MTGDANVTRRALTLGSRDSWSGWRSKTFTPSTIEMVIIKKGTTLMTTIGGFYSVLDGAGYGLDPVSVGDQVLDDGVYWDVEGIEPIKLLDSLICNRVDLNHARMYEADASAATWSQERASDARYKTKQWLVGIDPLHLRSSKITKDDDITPADYAIIFDNPPYPIEREFRAAHAPVQGLYVIDQPVSEPLRDADQIVRDYTDHVPIHVLAVNSTGCTGTALQHKMVAELQYVAETYPEGSQRTLERRSKQDRDLGGMWLYDTEYVLSYTREATT